MIGERIVIASCLSHPFSADVSDNGEDVSDNGEYVSDNGEYVSDNGISSAFGSTWITIFTLPYAMRHV